MVKTRGGKKRGVEQSTLRESPQPSTSQVSPPRTPDPQDNTEDIPPPKSRRMAASGVITSTEELRRLLEEEDDSEEEDSTFSDETDCSGSDNDDSEEEEDPSQGNDLLSPDSGLPSTSSQATTARLRQTTYTWTSDRPTIDPIPFTQTPGMTASPQGDQPPDFFNLLLTDSILELTVRETNRFADELKAQNVAPKARIVKWKSLTKEEFLVFLGVLYHMGTIRLNRISDFWSKDFLFNFPCFRGCMSRDRFSGILQCLHFAKNPEPGQPQPNDRLYKIRPLIDLFHDSVSNAVTPTQKLCVDESMLLWRGRLVFRMFLKGKKHKYGIKIYMLTEPSGLVLRFIVYTGSSDADVGGRGHVDTVVNKLMEGHLDAGHSLFMDNYYNSVNLAHQLLERKTYCTGTLRTNRKGNPPQINSKKLKKGEVVNAYTDDGVCVMKWKDKREVLMISSQYSGEMIDVPRRRGGGTIPKPEAIARYNEAMGGIDHTDQMMSYYPIERKTLKWYKKLGIHIFHLLLLNSYYLYKKLHPRYSFYDFRLSVIKSLLSPAFTRPSGLSPSVPSRGVGLSRHFPHTLPIDEKSKRNRTVQRRCRECQKKGIRKDTTFFCPACEGHPPLCVDTCFTAFHENMRL
ncbi:piggyBac transposable element-derived protein 4-like [Ischnura elegans]|uniref:piggyBac transposable element-derived protein 4-like n=1 Tax=Ischnura elegans TaxID=197161 RepID=UPI001ED8B569|nr:piggyBac transposable element-derived protein 4-like [Ischnura elegans]XP_046400978.1 piggyBac transposable element-derived protein 4-like [Ischnura elegans]